MIRVKWSVGRGGGSRGVTTGENANVATVSSREAVISHLDECGLWTVLSSETQAHVCGRKLDLSRTRSVWDSAVENDVGDTSEVKDHHVSKLIF